MARRLGELGFRDDDFIVACDDASGSIAARLWWMLDALGHHGGAAVLDGGVQSWTAAGFELSSGVGGDPNGPPLTLAPEWPRVIHRRELAEKLGSVALLDVRAAERYLGEVEPIDPRAGHIPTAISAPTVDNVDSGGNLRPPGELARRFEMLLPDGKPVVVSCGSGVTACHTALALRVAGLPDPILYAGSFSDWSRSDFPVATGADPTPPRRSRRTHRAST